MRVVEALLRFRVVTLEVDSGSNDGNGGLEALATDALKPVAQQDANVFYPRTLPYPV